MKTGWFRTMRLVISSNKNSIDPFDPPYGRQVELELAALVTLRHGFERAGGLRLPKLILKHFRICAWHLHLIKRSMKMRNIDTKTIIAVITIAGKDLRNDSDFLMPGWIARLDVITLPSPVSSCDWWCLFNAPAKSATTFTWSSIMIS